MGKDLLLGARLTQGDWVTQRGGQTMKEEVRWEEGVQGRAGSILIPENREFNLGIGSEIKRIASQIDYHQSKIPNFGESTQP